MRKPHSEYPRLTVRESKRGIHLAHRPTGKPVLVVHPAGKQKKPAIIVSLGKHLSPATIRSDLSPIEFQRLLPTIFEGFNREARRLPRKLGKHTYGVVSRTTQRLSKKYLHRKAYMVSQPVRITVPLTAGAFVHHLDQLAHQSQGIERQRRINRVLQIQRVLAETLAKKPMSRRFGNARIQRNAASSEGVEMTHLHGDALRRERKKLMRRFLPYKDIFVLTYLEGKKFLLRDPVLLATALAGAGKNHALTILQRLQGVGPRIRARAKELLERAIETGEPISVRRDTPTIEYFVRKIKSPSKPFATYDFFPRPLTPKEKELLENKEETAMWRAENKRFVEKIKLEEAQRRAEIEELKRLHGKHWKDFDVPF